MARGQRAQRRSRASGASPTDAGPGLADLPPEVLSRVLDFLSPPCAAGRAPLADGFPERGCSCGGGRAALLPLLRTSSALFGHVAARLWGHLALEDLALNSAENLSEPISEEDARTVERGEMVLRALESPRGATYGGLVRRLSLKLPEGASILARRLAVALPHMQHLSHLLVFLAVRSTATLWGANPDLERIWVAARSLPGLRGVRIPALPPAAVFARGLRSWPELEALHLPDGSVPAQLVPEQGFGKALAAAAPPSLRSLRLDGRIPGSDLAKLIDRLPLLDHLSLGVPDWVTPASCAAVAKAAARLRSLSLVMIVQHDYAPEMPREEILEALCGPRLESLTVTHFPLDEELANALGRALVRCPRLTELRLHRTKPLVGSLFRPGPDQVC
ncbi:hypothetical protein DFJ74DRAFT_683890 [Hyaloraphidium curvatum]|nr:hypothetical protein DFJ74DRAFT_683890 [Hyaloraphidium curvatum]